MGAWGRACAAPVGSRAVFAVPLVWTEDTAGLVAFLTVVWLGGEKLVRAALAAFRAGL